MADELYININGVPTLAKLPPSNMPLIAARVTALENAVDKTISIKGGTVEGAIIGKSGYRLSLQANPSTTGGAGLYLADVSSDGTFNGSFQLRAANGTSNYQLYGNANGELTWGQYDGNVKPISYPVENGTGYIRYSDGLQVCWGIASTSGSGTNTIQLDKAFVAGSWRVTATPTTATAIGANVGSTSTRSFVITSTEAVTVNYIAVGMWK